VDLDMDFSSVMVLSKCLSIIRVESCKAQGTETGGPLVGYVAKAGILIVTGATGPGPKARLERYSVTIDGEHAQRFCDQIRRESDGSIDYIGDWHKHTGISLKPSGQDVAAMKIMAEFEFSPTKHPISLIYRRWPEALQPYVWDGSGSLAKMKGSVLNGP
jgi:integrative and conjugative element protein (TIGR02256 family)